MRYLGAVFVVLASAASAAEVGPCNELDRISNLVGQTRSFSEGKIRIAHVDTDGEPVCCRSHLIVIIPDPPPAGNALQVSQKAANGEKMTTRAASAMSDSTRSRQAMIQSAVCC